MRALSWRFYDQSVGALDDRGARVTRTGRDVHVVADDALRERRAGADVDAIPEDGAIDTRGGIDDDVRSRARRTRAPVRRGEVERSLQQVHRRADVMERRVADVAHH